MILTKIPWADRVWPLPFLTALAPSERDYAAKTGWARQLLLQVNHWVGDRTLIAIGDSRYYAYLPGVINSKRVVRGTISNT